MKVRKGETEIDRRIDSIKQGDKDESLYVDDGTGRKQGYIKAQTKMKTIHEP